MPKEFNLYIRSDFHGRYLCLPDALKAARLIAGQDWQDLVVFQGDQLAAVVLAGGAVLTITGAGATLDADGTCVRLAQEGPARTRAGHRDDLIDLDALDAS